MWLPSTTTVLEALSTPVEECNLGTLEELGIAETPEKYETPKCDPENENPSNMQRAALTTR